MRSRFTFTAFVFIFPAAAFGQWSIVAQNLYFPNSYGAICYRDGAIWLGDHDVYMSLDSGLTWTLMGTPEPIDGYQIDDIQFFDRANGIVAEDGGTYVTSDAGVTWKQVLQQGTFGANTACFGRTRQTLLSATSNVGVSVSHDGGVTWKLFNLSDYPLQLEKGHDGTLYAFAGESVGGGFLYTSVDDGVTWKHQTGPADFDSYSFAVDSCEPNRVVLVNEDAAVTLDHISEIYVTTDQGTSWAPKGEQPVQFYSGSIAQSYNAIYCQTVEQGIYRSTDRGDTWIATGGPSAPYDTRYICAINDNIVLAVDELGNVWRTTNGGGTHVRPLNTSGALRVVPTSITYPDSVSLCNSPASDTLLIFGGCHAPLLVSATLVGGDAANFSSTQNNDLDSIIVLFMPDAVRGYSTALNLSFTDGSFISVPISGAGRAPDIVTLSMPPVANDTIGAIIEVPIILHHRDPIDSIELSLRYDTTALVYLGNKTVSDADTITYSLSGVGNARLSFALKELRSADTIIGYALFQVYPSNNPCSGLSLDSVSFPNGALVCATLSVATIASTQICSTVGCGTTTISDYLRYSRLPNLSIAPNPSTGDVTILSDMNLGSVNVQLFDALGSLRATQSGTLNVHDPIQISVASLPAGMYSIRVSSENFTKWVRLLHLR